MITIISLVAAPGSGKTTQRKLFLERFPDTQVVTASEVLAPFAHLIQMGQLVPDEIVNEKIQDAILEKLEMSPDFLVVDGYPRTTHQLQSVLGFLSPNKYFFMVVYIDLSLTTALRRIEYRKAKAEAEMAEARLNGSLQLVTGKEIVIRPDDDPEVVTSRFEEFNKKTGQMIRWLKGTKNYGYVPFLQVNGEGNPDQVFKLFGDGVLHFVEHWKKVKVKV